jgi:hypothetical protein
MSPQGPQFSPPADGPQKDKDTWLPVMTALIFIAVVLCIVAVIYLIFSSQLSSKAAPLGKTAPPASTKIIPSQAPSTFLQMPSDSALVLNGIIASPDGQLALINNQIFRAGDYVQGHRILSISENQVEILDDEEVVTLLIQR